MIRYKASLGLLCQLAVFVVWHHYDPIGTDILGIVLGIIFIGLALQIYFAPFKSKQETIAKFKARHGIPLDQPHKADTILRKGFFKAE
jgi:hypothetical protein